MKKIRVAIVGVGNCASALLQGIEYYRRLPQNEWMGLMHADIGGYSAADIEISAAFDIDERKVGKDLSEAIFAPPNCAKEFFGNIPKSDLIVERSPTLDGLSRHMKNYPAKETFIPSSQKELSKEEIVRLLKTTETEIILNYLPVGSEKATHFYAECALEAEVAFINNIPVFIASDFHWANRFKERNIPLMGDDIKSQCGATIVHRVLSDLFEKRGVKLERSYQINVGGNTDFLNMLNQERLASKKRSKTEAVQSQLKERLSDENIYVGPSSYIPWQKDNKICFLRMEGRLFGGVPMNLELRLSVEDSPNSAGCVIDAIRCCKLALLRGQGGVLPPSSYFMKHPPEQLSDALAYEVTERFIQNGLRTDFKSSVNCAID